MKITKKVISFLALLSVPCITQAAILYADTNGDGVTDTIASAADTYGDYVQIYHPNTGITNKYYIGSVSTGLTSLRMVGTANTNGLAGQEVVVLATFSSGAQVIVIDDANAVKRSTSFGSGLASISVVSIINNTNGIVGNEIIVRTETSSLIPTTSLHVVDDRNRVKRQYSFGTGLSSIKVVAITDTNGLTGDEIVMQLEASSSRSLAIQIIDDAKATTRQYNQSNNLTLFTIVGVRDYDGQAGAEVCYRATYSSSTYYQMIVDRIGSVVSRSGC